MSGSDSGGLLASLRASIDRLRNGDGRRDRRLVVALLLVVLIPVGAGFGTIALDFDGGVNDTTTEPVAVTPTSDIGPTQPPGEPDEPPTEETATSTATTPTGIDRDSDSEPAADDNAATSGSGDIDSGSTSGGGSDADSGVSLRATSSMLTVRASALAPGANGRDTVTFRNAGDEAGRLSVANITVEDEENGIVSAEQSVDSSPDSGELSGAIRAELRIESDSGTTHLYGTGAGARPLSALGSAGDTDNAVELSPGETATVVLVWRVPDSTGNEIQSDTASFDVRIALKSAS